MKIAIFKKKKLFVQDLNAKVIKILDFNTNFPKKIMLFYEILKLILVMQ